MTQQKIKENFMKSKLLYLGAVALVSASLCGDEAAIVRENLKAMPKPWKALNYNVTGEKETYLYSDNCRAINKITIDEYKNELRSRAKKYDFMTLEIGGKTFENDPIYIVKISSPDVPASKKHRVAVVTLHVGSERAGLYSALHAIDFLCSPEAKVYRDFYEIAIMPCVNPWGFFHEEGFAPWNSKRVIPYAPPESDWDIPNLQFKKIDQSPELRAFFKFMDNFKPEVLIDWHGTGRSIPGEIMTEYIGYAGSNHTLSPWSSRLIEFTIKEISKDGFHVQRLEENIQRLKNVTALQKSFPKRFRESRELMYPDIYPYVKYHTLPLIFEIGNEQMGVAALKGVLKFGMQAPIEYNGAFPVNNLSSGFGSLMIGAGGVTPAEKRASRVEIWDNVESFGVYCAYPKYYGRDLFVVACGTDGQKEFFGKLDPYKWHNLYLTKLFENRPDTEKYCWSAIKQFLQLGPENQFASINDPIPDKCKNKIDLKHGISFAFQIPISSVNEAEILDIRINGKTIPEAENNGYELLKTDIGYTVIVRLDSNFCKDMNFFVISCAYKSNTDTPVWGWGNHQ